MNTDIKPVFTKIEKRLDELGEFNRIKSLLLWTVETSGMLVSGE